MDLSNNIITSVDSATINGTKDEECIELKHIQYKTMIQNGVSQSINRGKGSINDLNTLEKFLENTTEINKTERWNKLDMTVKLNKINEFIEVYKVDNNQTDEEAEKLYNYLKDCLDKKKLVRVKDVVYDNETDKLISIPGLQYNRVSKKYTIKNIDGKKSSVLSRLPQKKSKTLKKEKDKES
jgi:hypothetical protein